MGVWTNEDKENKTRSCRQWEMVVVVVREQGKLQLGGRGDKARVAESLSLGTARSLTGNTRTVGGDHRLRDSGALGRCSL